MKISYQKTWDDDGYVVTQTIRSESKEEDKKIKNSFTSYTKKQKIKNMYSLGLTSTNILMKYNERIKNRNTLAILFTN